VSNYLMGQCTIRIPMPVRPRVGVVAECPRTHITLRTWARRLGTWASMPRRIHHRRCYHPHHPTRMHMVTHRTHPLRGLWILVRKTLGLKGRGGFILPRRLPRRIPPHSSSTSMWEHMEYPNDNVEDEADTLLIGPVLCPRLRPPHHNQRQPKI
jgi:hypothetical protein